MDPKVDAYIEKQKSPQREICKQLRELIFRTFPDVQEQMKWGVPSYDKGNYYIVALRTHVNIGFSLKGLSKEELSILHGRGSTMRHLEIFSREDIDENKIEKLLRIVKERT